LIQAAAEATKKLNTHRKKLRELARSLDYWTEDHGKKMTVMEQIERICIIADVNELTNICESLREISLYEQAFQRLSECVCFALQFYFV
jgi:hypothetical protein